VKGTPSEKCPDIPEIAGGDVDRDVMPLLGWFLEEYPRCAVKVDAQHE
jgi:hypothetical protein